ncbi:MAG: hypothetical protein KBD53_07735 [Candidatus Omnitrophica bacterium]|nr:hypothetical protein [Candidatus Omnitrophota bacterium]
MKFPIKFKSPQKLFLSYIIVAAVLLSTTISIAQETPVAVTDPSFKDKKTSEGFTLNLKELIDKSKKKMEQVDGKLKDQAKERRNRQREEKAREYYEKAMAAYEQGELEAARELWEKAIKITEHKEMDGYVSKSVRRQGKEIKVLEKEEERRIKRLETERGYSAKEVDKKYEEAVGLYKDKKYLASKVAFEEVNEMFPGHKATESYLALIDRSIEKDQKDIIESKLENKEFTSAKAKAAWKKDLEEQEETRQRNLYKQAEAGYKEAKMLYKDKQYKKAKDKFKEVEWILPDHKDTVKYLSRIDSDIAENGVQFSEEDKIKYFKNEMKNKKKDEESDAMPAIALEDRKDFSEERRREEEAAFVYEAAKTLYDKKFYEQALQKFYEVNALTPNYKATVKYIKKLEQKMPESKRTQMSEVKAGAEKGGAIIKNESVAKAISDRQKTKQKEAEEKYKEALKFYNQRNYAEAKRKFIAVESTLPAYKATREYLEHIDGNMVKGGKKIVKENSSATGTNDKKSTANMGIKEKYKQAIDRYDHQRFDSAKELFLEIEKERPGYRATGKYLEQISQRDNQSNNQNKIVRVDEELPPSEQLTFIKDENKSAPQVEVKEFISTDTDHFLPGDNVVEETYQEALELFKYERFSAAKAKFTTVEELSPGYKEAAAYIEESKQKMILDSGLDNKTKPLMPNLEESDSYENEIVIASEDKNSSTDTSNQEVDEILSSGSASEFRELYKLGQRLYKAKNYQRAKDIFVKIQQKQPDYKSVSEYIVKIDDLMEKEKTLREKYQQKILEVHNEEFSNADDVIISSNDASLATEDPKKIQKQTEHYFESLGHIASGDTEEPDKVSFESESAKTKNLEKGIQTSLKFIKSRVDLEYDEGVKLFYDGQYSDAKKKFLSVEQKQPDYENTTEYLQQIDVLTSTDKQKGWLSKQFKKDKKELSPQAKADALALARLMKSDEEVYYDLIPKEEYEEQIKVVHARQEQDIQEAKSIRLKRLAQEKGKEEDDDAFMREVNRNVKELEKQRAEEYEKQRKEDQEVKKEKERLVQEKISKMKEEKEKALNKQKNKMSEQVQPDVTKEVIIKADEPLVQSDKEKTQPSEEIKADDRNLGVTPIVAKKLSEEDQLKEIEKQKLADENARKANERQQKLEEERTFRKQLSQIRKMKRKYLRSRSSLEDQDDIAKLQVGDEAPKFPQSITTPPEGVYENSVMNAQLTQPKPVDLSNLTEAEKLEEIKKQEKLEADRRENEEYRKKKEEERLFRRELAQIKKMKRKFLRNQESITDDTVKYLKKTRTRKHVGVNGLSKSDQSSSQELVQADMKENQNIQATDPQKIEESAMKETVLVDQSKVAEAQKPSETKELPETVEVKKEKQVVKKKEKKEEKKKKEDKDGKGWFSKFSKKPKKDEVAKKSEVGISVEDASLEKKNKGKPDPEAEEMSNDSFLRRTHELIEANNAKKEEIKNQAKTEIALDVVPPVVPPAAPAPNSTLPLIPEQALAGPVDPLVLSEEQQNEAARLDRLKRLADEKLQEKEQRAAYYKADNLRIKEIKKQQAEEMKIRKKYELQARKDQKKRAQQQAEEMKKIKEHDLKDLADLKEETIKAFKQNDPQHAEELMAKYEDLLLESDLTQKERYELRNELNETKTAFEKKQNEKAESVEKIEKAKKAEKAEKVETVEKAANFENMERIETPEKISKAEKIERVKLATPKMDKNTLEENKQRIIQQRELDKIEERIREEEKKLERAQKKEDERLIRVSEEREKQLGARKEKKDIVSTSELSDAESISIKRKVIADLDKTKKLEIEKLVAERKKELKSKREEIQKEFNNSLSVLYKKAEKLYENGAYDESAEILEEIHRLRPGFKNTENYLAKIYRTKLNPVEVSDSSSEVLVKKSAPREKEYVRPTLEKKPNRLRAIKDALDSFEETMW